MPVPKKKSDIESFFLGHNIDPSKKVLKKQKNVKKTKQNLYDGLMYGEHPH